MKKVLLSCLAFAAGAAMAIAQDEPMYPSTLDFTLNGEKELKGVNVSQTMVPYDGSQCLTIKITGVCDADAVKMDFVTPAGWDYALIDLLLNGEDSPFMTRSGNHWLPLNKIDNNYKKGNSFNFPVDGKGNYGTIYLVKGDNLWDISIDIEFNVSKSGGTDPGDDPSVGDEPAFPTHLEVATTAKGLEYSQTIEWDVLTISLTGEISEPTFDVVLDVPEGWTGFISIPYEDSIEISESGVSDRNTRSEESYWMTIEEFIEFSESSFMPITPIKGNKFTFTPNDEEQDVAIYLYKDDKVYVGDYIALETSVSAKSNPNDPTGISSVKDGDKAAYYDLNGNKVRILNNGMYIKVADGNVTKVVVK